MAYLDYTRPDGNHQYRSTLCLGAEECALLLPAIDRLLQESRRKYGKYQSIHQAGEASERQVDLMWKYEEQTESLEQIKHLAEDMAGRGGI